MHAMGPVRRLLRQHWLDMVVAQTAGGGGDEFGNYLGGKFNEIYFKLSKCNKQEEGVRMSPRFLAYAYALFHLNLTSAL